MPTDEPKFFKEIKLEKKYLDFYKSKTIQDKSNNFHVICDLKPILAVFFNIFLLRN
jgi:hypothetical protein